MPGEQGSGAVVLCPGDTAAAAAPQLQEQLSRAGLSLLRPQSAAEAGAAAAGGKGAVGCVAAVAAAQTPSEVAAAEPFLEELRRNRAVFGIVLLLPPLCHDPKVRLELFAAGVRMIAHDVAAVCEAARLNAAHAASGGKLRCPHCGLAGMTEDALHAHYPLWHVSEPNIDATCPVCSMRCRADSGGLAVHYHNAHGPPAEREPPHAPFAAFSWVVVRRADGMFLMPHEPAGMPGCGGRPTYWLPAGRVDIGESLLAAGERETLEEGGVQVRITGVIDCLLRRSRRHPDTPTPRIVFLAEPVHGDAQAKSLPDFESAGAMWVPAAAVQGLSENDFRAMDPQVYFPAVEAGRVKAHPVTHPEFREFDALIQRLTRGEPMRPGELQERWQALKRVYPAAICREHG
eukprot:TRINITY_DN6405_c0_g1_i1.p1 TRINITY_DN6405_c0_g1~~TRINITY_DN6405_c0_g1_i1.p1  ORF type:complete len:443 (+),score=119.21 TRINITY_DN6405_c0_g1_i1:125-1330(+)